MNSIPVLKSLETPIQTVTDTENTRGQTSSNLELIKDSPITSKKDFKKQLEECGLMGVEGQPFFNDIINSGDGCKKHIDNSMCSDLLSTVTLSGIVGTLEGFDLLGYQTDENVSVLSEEIISILGNTISQMDETQKVSQELLESFVNGMLNDTEQGNGSSKQFAWMRPNEQLVAAKSMTQQEILQRVGEYLCSLESTNNNPSTEESESGIFKNATVQAEKPDGLMSTEKPALESPGTYALSGKASTNTEQEKTSGNAKQEKNSINAEPEKADIKSETGNSGLDTKPENTITTVMGTKLEAVQKTDGALGTQNENAIVKENVLSIVEKVSTNVAEGKQDFDIELKPEFLGKLNIKLVMENDSIRVSIKAQDASVKGLINDQLSALQDMLREKGIVVSNIDVFCESQGFSQQEKQMSDQNYSGKKNRWSNTSIAVTANGEIVYDTLLDLPDVYGDTSSVVFLA